MAIKKTIIIDANTDSAEKSIDGLQKSTENLSESTEGLTGTLDKLTGGAISGFRGVTQSVKKAVTGFKSLRVAIIATGIGALVVGVVSLIEAFKRSEEGQNKFAKLMGVIGAVTAQFLDAIAGLGTKIIDAFTNPKEAIMSFVNLIKQNIINRFEGLIELVPKLGEAITLLFRGKFGEAGKVAANAAAKVTLGVENIVEKTTEAIETTNEFIKATKEEARVAAQIADQRAKADIKERQLLLDRAEANRKIAELREIAADKENVSVNERLDALREAGRVNDEIAQKEIETARLRIEAKKAENELGLSTKEDKDEEARLQAELINLETNRLNTQKRLTAEITSALREEETERKAIEAERKAAEKAASDERLKLQKEEEEQRKKIADAAKQDALKQAELDKQLAIQKQQDITNALSNIAGIVGENSKFGKAIAVVQAIRDTFSGANKALAQGGIFGFIGAAAVIAGGLANVKSITSTKDPAPPSFAQGGGRGAPSVSAPTATATPPAFNIVGASDTNQLAEAIGGQAQQPVKAFVVSNDVSTAQELDRNIVEGASIG